VTWVERPGHLAPCYNACGLVQAYILSMTTSKIAARPAASAWPVIWLGVVAHLIWGSYPVLAKVALTGVPKLSLVLLAFLGITLAGFAIMR